MKIVSTKNAPAAIGPYSQAIEANGMVFTSGQIPLLPDGSLLQGNIEEQTHQVMSNLKAVLQAAQCKFEDVVKVGIFISDMDDFSRINEVYGEYFQDHKPARSTVAVKTLPKNVDIEIDMIAVKR